MLTDEQRKRVISNTLSGSMYVGLVLVEHKIDKIIKRRNGYLIYKGELTVKYPLLDKIFKLFITSDDINKRGQKEFGYINKVMIKDDQGLFVETDSYQIRKILGK